MKVFVALLLLLPFFFGCQNQAAETNKNIEGKDTQRPNIILFVGDGTGLSQISTLWYYHDEKPNYQRFTHVGLSKTNSASHQITDSGAGATAFSIGEKTYNGAIGVNNDSLPQKNVFEILEAEGYNTGVIATSSITHATPASFYAHVKSRNDHEAIAEDLSTSGIDFFAGGGMKYFIERKDDKNLLTTLRQEGFSVDTTSIDSELKGTKLGYFVARKALPTMMEGRGDFLPKATSKAIDFLEKQEKPFIIMIEGSQVDWGGHANDADYIISELKDLDNAVGVAIDFAEKDKNTSVIALADHETGGFALSPTIVQGFGGRQDNDYNRVVGKFTTDGHTCSHIPAFAFGPKAELFSGIYENNEVFEKLLELSKQ